MKYKSLETCLFFKILINKISSELIYFENRYVFLLPNIIFKRSRENFILLTSLKSGTVKIDVKA